MRLCPSFGDGTYAGAHLSELRNMALCELARLHAAVPVPASTSAPKLSARHLRQGRRLRAAVVPQASSAGGGTNTELRICTNKCARASHSACRR